MFRLRLAALLVLLLAACSSVKFGYSQLDWLVPHYVGRYVALDGTQSKLLKSHMTELLAWHCGTQVSTYAGSLRAISADLHNGPVTYARVAERYDLAFGYWHAIAEQAAPSIATLLATASEKQLDELFASFEKANDKFKTEYIDRPEPDVRQAAAKAMQRGIEDWVGDLTPGQRQAVAAWSRQWEPNGVERLEFRQRWQAELRRALNSRDEPDRFAAAVQTLVNHPEYQWSAEFKQKIERNREQTLRLLVAVGATLEPDQYRHFAKRANRWADDFEQLSCAKPQIQTTAAAIPTAQ